MVLGAFKRQLFVIDIFLLSDQFIDVIAPSHVFRTVPCYFRLSVHRGEERTDAISLRNVYTAPVRRGEWRIWQLDISRRANESLPKLKRHRSSRFRFSGLCDLTISSHGNVVIIGLYEAAMRFTIYLLRPPDEGLTYILVHQLDILYVFLSTSKNIQGLSWGFGVL